MPCHFIFLMLAFKEQMFLSLTKPSSSVFYLMNYLKNICLYQGHKDFLLCLLQKFYSFRSIIHFQLIFVYSEIWIELHFFIGIVLVPSVELTIDVWVCSTLCLYRWCVCAFANTTLSWLLYLYHKPWPEMMTPPTLLFFFKIFGSSPLFALLYRF